MPDEAAPTIQQLHISTQDLPHGDYVAAVLDKLINWDFAAQNLAA